MSRLSGPDLTQREDVITGLPRAKANHAINSIHFGPDGKLYVFGGRIRNADATTVNGTLNTTEMYAPDTDTWVPRAPVPTGRRSMAVGNLDGRAQ